MHAYQNMRFFFIDDILCVYGWALTPGEESDLNRHDAHERTRLVSARSRVLNQETHRVCVNIEKQPAVVHT